MVKLWVNDHWYDFADNFELSDRLLHWVTNSISPEFYRLATAIEKLVFSKVFLSNSFSLLPSDSNELNSI